MNRIFSQSIAKYMPVISIPIALLLVASALALMVAPTSAALPQQPKPVGGSATPTTSITATDTPISTSTFTPTFTRTPYPTSTSTVTPTACTIQFSDVPEGSTYYDYVRCLACRGVLTGYPDGTFHVDMLVTRGQLAKILNNAVGYIFPIPGDRQTFEDVEPDSTFWIFVEHLANYTLVRGYPCGIAPDEPCIEPDNRPYFRPGSPASRGQIVRVMHDILGYLDPIPKTRQTFQDVEQASTYWLSVERLVEREIFTGYTCGAQGEPCIPPENKPYFRPSSSATRGQVAKFVANGFFIRCVTPLFLVK